MKARVVLPLACWLVLLTLPVSEAQSPQPRPSDDAFREKYAVIVERNIFSRSRTSPSRRREEPRPVERPPEPEDLVVFTGTVEQGPARLAFVEERGRTSKVREGDEIARGKVVKIGFNTLEFEKDGKRTVVEIGKSFSGKSAPSSSRSRDDGESRRPSSRGSPVASESAASPQAPAGEAARSEPAREEPKAESSGGASDILERLRRRRLEEEKAK